DLENLDALRDGIRGADVVFHIAGRVMAPTYRELEQANVDATENLLRIAQKEGNPKIVVLSSLAAAGPSNGRPKIEQDSLDPVSRYGRSKNKWKNALPKLPMNNHPLLYCGRPPFTDREKIRFTLSLKW